LIEKVLMILQKLI